MYRMTLPILPIEIVNEILEYSGSITHYKLFHNLREELCRKSMIMRITNTKSWEFEDIFDKEERFLIYTLFEQCNCCEIHKRNRPNLDDYHNKCCPPYKTHYIRTDKTCKCMCRSICRHICRLDNDEIDESL